MSVGGRWPADYVRDSTAFWTDRGEVTWRCFTVFHVELSVERAYIPEAPADALHAAHMHMSDIPPRTATVLDNYIT